MKRFKGATTTLSPDVGKNDILQVLELKGFPERKSKGEKKRRSGR